MAHSQLNAQIYISSFDILQKDANLIYSWLRGHLRRVVCKPAVNLFEIKIGGY